MSPFLVAYRKNREFVRLQNIGEEFLFVEKKGSGWAYGDKVKGFSTLIGLC